MCPAQLAVNANTAFWCRRNKRFVAEHVQKIIPTFRALAAIFRTLYLFKEMTKEGWLAESLQFKNVMENRFEDLFGYSSFS